MKNMSVIAGCSELCTILCEPIRHRTRSLSPHGTPFEELDEGKGLTGRIVNRRRNRMNTGRVTRFFTTIRERVCARVRAGSSSNRTGAVASAMPRAERLGPPMEKPEEVLQKISSVKAAILYTSNSEKDTAPIISILRDAGIEEPLCIRFSDEGKKIAQNLTMHNTWPLVYVKGDPVGGLDELTKLAKTGILAKWIKDHQYDLIVIGGGSGGLAAAKEAAKLGKKVACLDYVKPSAQGSTWGLGGTCVNVGCIPKKLMHQASLLGHSIKDAKKFGWKIPEGEVTHSWKIMKNGIQDHIASLNWGYRVALREKSVTYVNAYGEFTGSHEIKATNKKGKVETLTADRFLIATGLRPKYPEIPGAREYCISSDDLFALAYPPGKTLCVGASYVSLECAGFLHGIGYEVTVMVRSILLRGFDQDMAERIRKHMIDYGMKFVSGVPSRIEEIEPKTKTAAGRLRVFWDMTDEEGNKKEVSEEYNTVLMAIGREARTDDCGLDLVGVKRAKGGKVVGRREQSSTPYIYAIGDVLEGVPELTPVAIQAGRVLMRRLFQGTMELTEYEEVPTTVFTPLEYGCCGLSEEHAIEKYGKENLTIYHNVFIPLEYTVAERMENSHCYLKLICLNKEDDRVVGFHILTPWAGEVTQGFAIGMKLGAKKSDFDRLIGIHPTVAENFTTLTLIKKEDGEKLEASGC